MSRLLAVSCVVGLALGVAGCGPFGEKTVTVEDTNTTSKTNDADKRAEVPKSVRDAAKKAGCEVKTPPLAEPEHIGEGPHLQLTHEEYSSDPPTSGVHFGITGAWGIYDEQLQDEYAVHNLEHGGAVIWAKDVAAIQPALERMLKTQPKVIVSPREDLPEDEVVATTWGAMMRCSGSATQVEPALEAWITTMVGAGPTDEANLPPVVAGTRPDGKESTEDGLAELPEPPEPVIDTSQS